MKNDKLTQNIARNIFFFYNALVSIRYHKTGSSTTMTIAPRLLGANLNIVLRTANLRDHKIMAHQITLIVIKTWPGVSIMGECNPTTKIFSLQGHCCFIHDRRIWVGSGWVSQFRNQIPSLIPGLFAPNIRGSSCSL